MTDRTLTWREPRWLWTGLAWLFAGPLNPLFLLVLLISFASSPNLASAAPIKDAGFWQLSFLILIAPCFMGATLMAWGYEQKFRGKFAGRRWSPMVQAIVNTWLIYPVFLVIFLVLLALLNGQPVVSPVIFFGLLYGWLVGLVVAPLCGITGWLVFNQIAFTVPQASPND